jgi:hypothetical protein
MKKGKLKEEKVPKISIIAKREKDEFDDDILIKFIEKKEKEEK